MLGERGGERLHAGRGRNPRRKHEGRNLIEWVVELGEQRMNERTNESRINEGGSGSILPQATLRMRTSEAKVIQMTNQSENAGF